MANWVEEGYRDKRKGPEEYPDPTGYFSGGRTVDPQGLCGDNDFNFVVTYPPSNADMIFVRKKVVVRPFNPAADQTASADEIVRSNKSMSQLESSPSGQNNNHTEIADVAGAGAAIEVEIPAGRLLVVDSLGIDSWSYLAEWELLWTLSLGASQAAGQAAPSGGKPILTERRGFPFGGVNSPFKILGNRVTMAHRTARKLSLFVRHAGGATVATHKSYPHYAEVLLQGWTVPVNKVGKPVGGAPCS